MELQNEKVSKRRREERGQYKGREIVASVEEVSKESGECSRKGRVVVENDVGNSVF